MCGYRVSHGDILAVASEAVAGSTEIGSIAAESGASALVTRDYPFGYLFRELQDDPVLNLLPPGDKTVESLRNLGDAMGDPGTSPGVPTPTAYTFFGQFVDHDITSEKASASMVDIFGANPQPIPLADIEKMIVNSRSPNLDLDSVYDPVAPRDGNKLHLDKVSAEETLPPGKDPLNDLPRRPRSSPPDEYDRAALIGDPRNDENAIVSQLHVAFIRAHNALVDQGCDFDEAKKRLIQHYQWIVLHDFLHRVVDPTIIRKVLREEPRFFTPPPFFMPLEFSVAAYRFGHSKVREVYLKYNKKQKPTEASIAMLFYATKFIGTLTGHDNIAGNWVIDWTNFLSTDDPESFPRPIDTTLSPTLLDLPKGTATIQGKNNLAVRNLLRGYILGMPTGQAVASWMQKKSPSIRQLTKDEIASVVSLEQLKILQDSDLINHTPLWFYILAEAAYFSRGYHLGPVGGTIVAEVLIGVLQNSDYSILKEPGWKPTLKRKVPGEFELSDLLALAGVL